jgi:hypothetical protein
MRSSLSIAVLLVGCTIDVDQPSFGSAPPPEDAADEASSSSGHDDAQPPDDGSASTSGATSNPGSDDPPTPESCGNGQLDEGELCDGQQFAVSCEDFGFDGGTLACTLTCDVSTSGCIGCGNDKIEGDELCDGTDLGGESCQSLGFVGGALACSDDCSDLLTDGCVEPVCGDGMLNGDEVCDDLDFGGQTCASIDPGFVGGALGCADDCSAIYTDDCQEPVCGDGVANGEEVCDGNDFAGKTCNTEGFDAGSLTCSDDCSVFDTDECFFCAQAGQSCASQACCPGSTCTDFGFNILLCV